MNPIQNKASMLYVACVALFTSALCLAQEFESPPHSESNDHPHWYLGGGLASLTLDDDHPSIGNNNGTGPYLLGGIQFFDRLSVELSSASTDISVTPTCDLNLPQTCELIYYPGDSAEYYNLLMGFRLGFPLANHPNLQPWIATGYAYHYYSWDTFWYTVDGSAPYFAAGLDIRVGKRWDIRLELNHTRYDSTDNYGSRGFNGTTTEFAAAMVYVFR